MRPLIYIDTGAQGAIAWRSWSGQIGVADLPIVTVELAAKNKSGKPKTRTEVDSAALHRIMCNTICAVSSPDEDPLIGIEALPATLKGSVFSALLQGANFGRVDGVARCVPDAIVEIHDARAVRSVLGIPTVKVADHLPPLATSALAKRQAKAEAAEERKRLACECAARHFPALADRIYPPDGGRRSKTYDGRADALCGLAMMIERERREG